MTTPDDERDSLLRRLQPVVGECHIVAVPPGGDVGVLRGTISAADRKLFARWAFSPPAVEGLRTEIAVLTRHAGIGPETEAIDETETDVVVVSEHLDPASWATLDTLDRAWSAVDEMAGLDPPPSLPRLEPGRDPWHDVDPTQLGDIGEWVERWQPSLAMAATGVDLSGERLVHGDLDLAHIWSSPDRLVVVDWEFAAIGNPTLDRATVALDAARLGADPTLFGLEPAWPAYLAGVMAAAIQAGPPPTAREQILEVNRRISLLEHALRWAGQRLSLPDLPRPPPEV